MEEGEKLPFVKPVSCRKSAHEFRYQKDPKHLLARGTRLPTSTKPLTMPLAPATSPSNSFLTFFISIALSSSSLTSLSLNLFLAIFFHFFKSPSTRFAAACCLSKTAGGGEPYEEVMSGMNEF